MFGQVIMAYEGFSTFITLVAFIVMVDSEVEPIQGTVCSESFSATLLMTPSITNTREILQMSPDPPVGAAVTETLATDTTEVRFLTTVDPQVLPQCCPLRRKSLSIKQRRVRHQFL